MSAEKVDVLDILDRRAAYLRHAGQGQMALELRNAKEAVRDLIDAASALTVHSDGRGYFESGAACNRFRAALAKVTP